MPQLEAEKRGFVQYKSIDKLVNEPHGKISEGGWCASISMYLPIWETD